MGHTSAQQVAHLFANACCLSYMPSPLLSPQSYSCLTIHSLCFNHKVTAFFMVHGLHDASAVI